jgi:hypothetical protein
MVEEDDMLMMIDGLVETVRNTTRDSFVPVKQICADAKQQYAVESTLGSD